MTPSDIARLAAAISILRPDWPERSLHTFIASKLGQRPMRDVAVALAWIATDGETKTPARLSEAGPWWQASATSTNRTPDVPRVDRDQFGRAAAERGDYETGAKAARALLRRLATCPVCHASEGRHGAECPNRAEEA